MLTCTRPAGGLFPTFSVLVPRDETVKAEPVGSSILRSGCHSHVVELWAEVEGVLLWLADGAVVLKGWSLG